MARRRPRSRATTGAAFWAKAALTAAWRASGMQARQSYRWVPGHRLDPDAPNGVRPLEPPASTLGGRST